MYTAIRRARRRRVKSASLSFLGARSLTRFIRWQSVTERYYITSQVNRFILSSPVNPLHLTLPHLRLWDPIQGLSRKSIHKTHLCLS